MAHDSKGEPPSRLFSVVPKSDSRPQRPASEPIVLALLVADALEKAQLSRSVLKIRDSPAGWVNFLLELESLLREGSRRL